MGAGSGRKQFSTSFGVRDRCQLIAIKDKKTIASIAGTNTDPFGFCRVFSYYRPVAHERWILSPDQIAEWNAHPRLICWRFRG
jgi:hypothetical protein